MNGYAKPLPRTDVDTQPFWDACKLHELQAQRCTDCQRFRWPPQAFCPECYSWNFEWTRLPQTGKVETFVVVHYAAVAAFQPDIPYVIAHIAIDGTDGRVHIVSNVIGCPWEEVTVGMPVKAVFEDVTPEVTLAKFKAA
jgi:uncharacterized protein